MSKPSLRREQGPVLWKSERKTAGSFWNWAGVLEVRVPKDRKGKVPDFVLHSRTSALDWKENGVAASQNDSELSAWSPPNCYGLPNFCSLLELLGLGNFS